MIDLTTLTVEHITKQFNDALIPGAGNLAPRNGYYHVRRFEYRTINGKNNIPIIRANWKANREDLFIDDAEFDVAVSCLKTGPYAPQNDLTNLVGWTFQVYEMSMSYEIQNNKQKAKITGSWLRELMPHKFFNRTEAIFLLLGSDLMESKDGTIKVLTDELYGIDYEQEACPKDSLLDYEEDPENQLGIDEQNSENGELPPLS